LPLGGREVRGTTIRDLTAQRRAEETLRQSVQQQEQLRAQSSRLAELSTPVIPIRDDILVLPLIGSIDSARAQLVMEAMLEGVARTRAHTAIIDVTGVTGIDTQVADALLDVARAVRLLGAEVIVTGIRPEVARTLVVLGTDLSSLVSKGTLQSGIAHAMARSAR
jgi:anti-anti-sigma factor